MESLGLKGKGLHWAKLWKRNLPSKIKVFGLRFYQNILPTKEYDGLMESSGLEGKGLHWAKLWKSNLPSKIKVFGLRVYQNVLPTKENLYCRKVVKDSFCKLCRQDAKSVLYVLWECGVARDMWAGSKYDNIADKDVSDEEIEAEELRRRMWKDHIKLKRIKEGQKIAAQQVAEKQKPK
nr:ethylene insensitive 3-like 3 protein [Quercus suber]